MLCAQLRAPDVRDLTGVSTGFAKMMASKAEAGGHMGTTTTSLEAEQAVQTLFMTADGRIDPYPLYAQIRSAAPVHYSEMTRSWLISNYDDCYSALRDPRIGKDFEARLDERAPWWRERRTLVRFSRSMLNIDGPEHTRLRRMVSKLFTFRSVDKLRPAIDKMVDELIEPLAQAGGGDLVTQLAFPLPVKVIGELLGVPAEDRDQFRALVLDITRVFEMKAHREDFDVADAATEVIDDYFLDLINRKRARPDDGLLSRLANATEDGQRLTDDELITMATLLFVAGFETTTNLIGNGMVGFLKHPDQMDAVRARPELTSGLAFETLRYDGTVQMAVRQAMDDYEVGGMTIPAGQSLTLMLAGGNHDPARYDNPDALDVNRIEIKPLSFGGGIHFCLGAALAAVEIEVVFRKLFDRFAVVEPDGDIPSHRDRLTLRGMDALPLILETSGKTRPSTPRPSAPATVPAPASRPVAASTRDLPPRPAGDDSEWRAAFRRRVEQRPSSDTDLDAKTALLASIPLFGGCTPHELEDLARTAYPIAFDAGDVLCVEGADPGECYVIAEGEATVRIGDQTVATVGADDVVGEKGPIEGRPRAATVTATTHMITYSISRAHLQRLLDDSPSAAAKMRELVAQRYPGS